MFEGGCYCGAVRYRAVGEPFHKTHCHCTICRRTSAAAFVSWVSFRSDRFSFTRGDPARFDSTSSGERSFCSHCGTPLTCSLRDFPDEIDVTVCSLDDPDAIAFDDHTHVATRLAGVELADGLPQFRGARADG